MLSITTFLGLIEIYGVFYGVFLWSFMYVCTGVCVWIELGAHWSSMCNDGSWVIAGTLVQKVQFFLHLFLTVLNSSTRNHQNLMMLPRLLYSLASILILFFGEFQTKRVENYQVWRWSPLTKEWREVAAARRKLSYTVWTRKLVADQFAGLCKWRNYQKEQIMTSKVICN